MKKLMFAAALAASAAAFAGDLINAISFENSDYALIDNATNLTARADKPDPDGRNDNGTYFLYEAQSGSSDSSFVTNAAAAFTDKGTAYFSGLENFTNEKFLALDTEGGTLWRSIGTLTGNSDALGTARAVAATGTYLDTLVQFTVTEDEAPTVGADDKLAIWLQADNGTTNLMVRAGSYDSEGTPVEGGASFILTGKTIQPGEWYRLTVKAVDDILPANELYKIPGFQILIDSDPVSATTSPISTEFTSALREAELITAEQQTAINSGVYLPSLVAGTPGIASSLQAVGFQGTGAVDEIVWTEQNLFPADVATTIQFTLTGAENATVSYVIGSGESQPWDGTSTISVDSGAEVTFTATPASGYTYAGVTAEGWTLNNSDLVCTTNSAENITIAVPGAIAITYTLTVPTVANATLTAPASLTGIAPGTTVTLEWTAAEGYTFPNGSTTMTKTVTVNSDMTIDVSDVESSLSKQVLTVTVTDIENATIAATTNSIALTDALSENTTTNEYTVEYGATVTVTATAAEGYEFVDTPEGWTLNDGVLSFVTNNVTADVELAAPATRMSIVEIAVPTAATGLIYDGTAKTGVATGTGYTLSGDVSATAAGNYTATATLESGYAWVGGSTEAQTINWSIAQATVTATVSLDPATATFDSAKTTPSAYTTPSVSFGGETLVENTDYTVAWSSNEVTGEGTFTYTVSPVVGSNYTFTEVSATLTITAPQTEDWVADVSTITAGTKASEQYSSLAGTEVANADAVQLTTWAKGVGNVAFADAGKDEINVEAFLLNIANDSTTAQIDAAKEAFVLNITVAADGTPTVTLPSGKTYNGKVQMKGSNDLSTWTDVNAASKTYHFYKYELSLPAAE